MGRLDAHGSVVKEGEEHQWKCDGGYIWCPGTD